MESNVQHVVKQVSKFDGKNADNFLEWSSKLRVPAALEQANLRNCTRVAAAISLGQRSGDRSRGLG